MSMFWFKSFRKFFRKIAIFRNFDHWSEILSMSAGRPLSQGVCPPLVLRYTTNNLTCYLDQARGAKLSASAFFNSAVILGKYLCNTLLLKGAQAWDIRERIFYTNQIRTGRWLGDWRKKMKVFSTNILVRKKSAEMLKNCPCLQSH